MGEEVKSKTYSHSKLWLFENCPEAYKIKYIDKTFPDLPSSIHAFLGDVTHQSLEWLYNEKIAGKEVSCEELIEHFSLDWMNQFSEELRISFGRAEDYFVKGVRFLAGYYQEHFPFEEKTLNVEKQINFDLDDVGEYKIIGYIDRIALKDGVYEVHDYKTNEAMKTQNQVDNDRQLAFYHLGLKQIYGEDIQVKLIWHFLAHGKSIESSRTDEQLEKLRRETLALIKRIESTKEWPACGKKFCDWCSYKRKNFGQMKLGI